MLCGTDNVLWDISYVRLDRGIFYKILSDPHIAIMDVNNVMNLRYICLIDSLKMMGSFCFEVLNFNWLFLKVNHFICN